MKLKKGDNVILIAGKDKGKKGKVLEIFKSNDRVLVEGANLSKKHMKPRRSDQKGQTIEKAMPIHVSNVMILDSKEKKGTRVGYKTIGDKKVRIAKKSGVEI